MLLFLTGIRCSSEKNVPINILNEFTETLYNFQLWSLKFNYYKVIAGILFTNCEANNFFFAWDSSVSFFNDVL